MPQIIVIKIFRATVFSSNPGNKGKRIQHANTVIIADINAAIRILIPFFFFIFLYNYSA
jgi:hypothetical protein